MSAISVPSTSDLGTDLLELAHTALQHGDPAATLESAAAARALGAPVAETLGLEALALGAVQRPQEAESRLQLLEEMVHRGGHQGPLDVAELTHLSKLLRDVRLHAAARASSTVNPSALNLTPTCSPTG